MVLILARSNAETMFCRGVFVMADSDKAVIERLREECDAFASRSHIDMRSCDRMSRSRGRVWEELWGTSLLRRASIVQGNQDCGCRPEIERRIDLNLILPGAAVGRHERRVRILTIENPGGHPHRQGRHRGPCK